jgi:hypothetical protein
MEYSTLSGLCNLLSRPFAADFLRLLVNYTDISASEAASRLDLHIKTAQDFLEGLLEHKIVESREVMEGKRPYFRYRLVKRKINLSFDLDDLKENSLLFQWEKARIREKANNGAVFSTGNRTDQISSVSLFLGEGRNKKERRISLTQVQGKFLFHLPFPNMEPLKLENIMKKAGLSSENLDEILDILVLLYRYEVIEKVNHLKE